MGLKWFFCLKILKSFKLWISSKNKWGSLDKKLECFVKIGWFGKLDKQSVSNCVFTQKFSNRLDFGFFWKNLWIFLRTHKFKKKLLSASGNVLMLKNSQNVQKLEFLEKKCFFSGKELVFFFRKTANFGNSFKECIWNCKNAPEFSKLSKLVSFRKKKIECSKRSSKVSRKINVANFI